MRVVLHTTFDFDAYASSYVKLKCVAWIAIGVEAFLFFFFQILCNLDALVIFPCHSSVVQQIP